MHSSAQPPAAPPPFRDLRQQLLEVKHWPTVDDSIIRNINRHPQLSVSEGIALVHVNHGGLSVETTLLRRSANHTKGVYPVFIYNPAIFNQDNIFLKLSPFSFCINYEQVKESFRGERFFSRYTVWLQRGLVRQVVWHAEDARPFIFKGRMHMLFNRKMPRILRRTMWLAQLEPNYDEVPLIYDERPNVSQARDEANWVPIPHNKELYVSYTICPHRVLQCSPTNGSCILFSNNATRIACDHKLHGGTPMVKLGQSFLLGVAHRKWWSPKCEPANNTENSFSLETTVGSRNRSRICSGYLYNHLFYAVESAPPFSLVAASDTFVFPPYFYNVHDRTQFAAGLALHDDQLLNISYGVGDCVALRAEIPLLDVLQQFCKHPARCTDTFKIYSQQYASKIEV